MIVVDASVATKWLLNELGTPAALELLNTNHGRLAAPAIVRIEVANAVVRQLREGHRGEADVQALCSNWERMLQDGVVTLTSSEELFDDALRLAVEIRHTIPDCLYLALAVKHEVPLITADTTMYERGLRVHRSITLLGTAA